MILADHEIRALATQGMIEPWIDGRRRPGEISYGISSFGYDARLASDVQLVAGNRFSTIDPKNFDPSYLLQLPPSQSGTVSIPPQGFALGHTIEHFRIPRDVLVVCIGKSTYARCGLIVNVTPLEPGWEGQVTLELHNTTGQPILVYPGEGICQFTFHRGAQPEISYADRAGKYQGQRGVTVARVEG